MSKGIYDEGYDYGRQAALLHPKPISEERLESHAKQMAHRLYENPATAEEFQDIEDTFVVGFMRGFAAQRNEHAE